MKVDYLLKLLLLAVFAFSLDCFAQTPEAIVVKEGVDHKLGESFGPSKQAVFSCILKAVGANYTMKRRPMSRHMRELGEPPFDISFPVSSKYVLKAGEKLSAPLALEEWYWVMRSKLENGVEHPSDKNSSIAVIGGSEEEYWLQSSGVTNLLRVSGLDQLVRLFTTGRVDVLLIDRDSLKELALDMGLDITPYFFKFERYVSFSALFSSALVSKRPELVELFNRSIPSCATEEVLLDPIQKVSLEAYAHEVFRWIKASPEISEALKGKLEIERFDHLYLDSLERKWLAPKSTLVKSVLDRPLSKKLAKDALKKFQDVKEIIVFDRSGALVAASGVTSDYYQGDEMKFTQTFSKNQNQFFDRLRFDESTGKFLVQITVVLKPAKSTERSLGITIGIVVSDYLGHHKNQAKK